MRHTSDDHVDPPALARRNVDTLRDSWAMLLRTRKRDGTWVSTPVNVAVAVEGDRAYFGTAESAGKVKRLRNFVEVEVMACTPPGRPTGPAMSARARLLSDDEAVLAERLLRRKYRFVYRILVPLELKLKRTRGLHYELTDVQLIQSVADSYPI